MAGPSMPLFAVCSLGTLIFLAKHGMASDRSLLAEQKVSKCNWIANRQCSLNPAAVLSVPATDEASNLARKFAAAYAACPSYSSQEQCDQPTTKYIGCSWNSATRKCTMESISTAALAACPGSKAARILQCNANVMPAQIFDPSTCRSPCIAVIFNELQNKNTGRHLLNPSNQTSASGALTPIFTSSRSMGATTNRGTEAACMPSDMADVATIQEFNSNDVWDATTQTHNEWWGSCESMTVYDKALSKLEDCSRFTNDACQDTHTCYWDSSSGSCSNHDATEFVLLADISSGTFASTVRSMYTACHAATDNTTCAAVGKAKYDDTAIASALAYTQNTSGATAATGSSSWQLAAGRTLQIMLAALAALAAMMLAVAV